jgi:hypothetical protein
LVIFHANHLRFIFSAVSFFDHYTTWCYW